MATDAIKTEAEAIKAAKAACEKKHYRFEDRKWKAQLSGGTWWVQNTESGMLDIPISKRTGEAVGAGCTFVNVDQVTD